MQHLGSLTGLKRNGNEALVEAATLLFMNSRRAQSGTARCWSDAAVTEIRWLLEPNGVTLARGESDERAVPRPSRRNFESWLSASAVTHELSGKAKIQFGRLLFPFSSGIKVLP